MLNPGQRTTAATPGSPYHALRVNAGPPQSALTPRAARVLSPGASASGSAIAPVSTPMTFTNTPIASFRPIGSALAPAVASTPVAQVRPLAQPASQLESPTLPASPHCTAKPVDQQCAGQVLADGAGILGSSGDRLNEDFQTFDDNIPMNSMRLVTTGGTGGTGGMETSTSSEEQSEQENIAPGIGMSPISRSHPSKAADKQCDLPEMHPWSCQQPAGMELTYESIPEQSKTDTGYGILTSPIRAQVIYENQPSPCVADVRHGGLRSASRTALGELRNNLSPSTFENHPRPSKADVQPERHTNGTMCMQR